MGNVKNSQLKKSEQETSTHHYRRFREIDGRHPLKELVPEAVVEYKARTRKGGEVGFFNFTLAKEIGLIPIDHEEVMTTELRQEILHAFSILIINEYDVLNKVEIDPKDVRPHTYMATRYLQLQHPCKKGTTSGDGRSIWNGQIKNNGKVYDISSCGTGATKLSPACNINKKFYQSGDPTISYGCGFSEKDEGLSALFFSEVLNKNGIETERVLAIIEFEKGIAINVRVQENLLRPSHMFNHLKQSNLPVLKKMVDYYIARQIENGLWGEEERSYEVFLKQLTETFARMAANFEDHYIFCWLDWDGDNILMNGGIIDYGSVRQFGLYHHEYRYDDVERWSTTIKEQKEKAKYIVQTFAQIVDYLATGKKKAIDEFKNHPALKRFDQSFVMYKNRNLLHKIGLKSEWIKALLAMKEVEDFKTDFVYFEMAKSHSGPKKVPDGMNWNAIFCMRDILRELPQLYLSRGSKELISSEEFLDIIKSTYAVKKDLAPLLKRDARIKSFQKNYLRIIESISLVFKIPVEKVLLEISMRSSVINKYDRVTGDSITTIVSKIMKERPRLDGVAIAKVLGEFVEFQNLNPEKTLKVSNFEKAQDHSKIVKGILKIVREFRDGI